MRHLLPVALLIGLLALSGIASAADYPPSNPYYNSVSVFLSWENLTTPNGANAGFTPYDFDYFEHITSISPMGRIRLPNVGDIHTIYRIDIRVPANAPNLMVPPASDAGVIATTFRVGTQPLQNATGRLAYTKNYNWLGQFESIDVSVYFDNTQNISVTGPGDITITGPTLPIGVAPNSCIRFNNANTNSPVLVNNYAFQYERYNWPSETGTDSGSWGWLWPTKTTYRASWKNDITAWRNDTITHIDIQKFHNYGDHFILLNNSLISRTTSLEDYAVEFLTPDRSNTTIVGIKPSWDNIWLNFTIWDSGDSPGPGPGPVPGNATATVYVRDSQTGALVANSRVVISESGVGELYNTTLSGGVGSFSVGKSQTIRYAVSVTADGYTQMMPHFFGIMQDLDIVIEMVPDTAPPDNPDNVYVQFNVRDHNLNPVSGAAIDLGSEIRSTNSAGYVRFEAAKNSTLHYTARKTGYITVSGAVTTETDNVNVNVILYSGVIPTNTPTTEPTGTAGPGPGGPTPTPDTRTNEQKGQAVIDLIADFAEPIAVLAILATIFGLMNMMIPGRRR